MSLPTTPSPLEEEDETTGISYSPSGEAHRLAKWIGVLVLAPVIWTMTFVWFDSLCGDVRKSRGGLLALTLFAHNAPEGMLDGCIYMMGFGAFSIIFAALSAAYVLPHIGTLFLGPEDGTASSKLPCEGFRGESPRLRVPRHPAPRHSLPALSLTLVLAE